MQRAEGLFIGSSARFCPEFRSHSLTELLLLTDEATKDPSGENVTVFNRKQHESDSLHSDILAPKRFVFVRSAFSSVDWVRFVSLMSLLLRLVLIRLAENRFDFTKLRPVNDLPLKG